MITLYDTLLQAAVDRLGLKVPARPSFTRDIYPILESHEHEVGERMVTDAHAHAMLEPVIPPPGSRAMRKAIFERLRDPAPTPGTETESDMPMIWSDYYPAKGNEP